MKPIPKRALAGVLSQPWAIQPEWLKTITEIVQRQGEDPEALAARLGRPLERSVRVQVRDGTAILPVTGPIFPRANMMTELSGATSLDILARDLRTALDSDSVESVLLDIDSPGGVAFGIEEMAGMIAAADKPVTAFVGGLGASAAYWLAASADQIVAAPSALLGSIGVVATVVAQEQPDRDGFREFEIVSSNAENKRPDPRSDSGRAEIRRIVDDLESVFVGDVARFRGVSRDTVTGDFGRGGVLVGSEAVAAGMADRTGTFEDTLAGLAAGREASRSGRLATASQKGLGDMAPKSMTAADLAAQHPEAVEEIRAAAKTEALEAARPEARRLREEAAETAKAEGLAAGAEAERARIAALKEAALPGFEGLLEECIADGSSTAADLAVKTVALQKQQGSTALAAAQAAEQAIKDKIPAPGASADGGAAADAAAIAASEGEDGALDPEALAARTKAAWDKNADLRGEFGNDYAAYEAWRKANAEGRVRIFGRA